MIYSKRAFVAVFALTSFSGFASAQVREESLPRSLDTSVGQLESSESLSKQANQLSQTQWIRLTAEGGVRGTVWAPSNGGINRQGALQVALVLDGATRYASTTDVDGDFIIEAVQPGSYSLVVTGKDQLAVCPLTVLGANEGKHLPDQFQIRTIYPATKRVAQLIRGNTMPSWTVGPKLTTDPIAETRNTEVYPDVVIDSRGGISGTLSRPNVRVNLSSTLVYLIRDGKEIERVRASSNGDFRFNSVTPGDYGLVASGSEGILGIGFTAVAKNDLASAKRPLQLMVSHLQPITTAQESLNLELADPDAYVPTEAIQDEEVVVVEEYPYAPGTFGGMGGGGMGGGGGIGASGGLGSGGLGGIGTLAALGALTAVAISQANDLGDQAPIVSPIK